MNPYLLSPGFLLYQRYSIQKTLGQGGFGITYLAYDQKLEQEVCIKELFISGNSTRGSNMTVQSQGTAEFSFADFVQRFIKEARQLAKFKHPNIVRVIDIFQENNTAYTVMEYVNGETLKEKIQREGVLEEKNAMLLINQLLDAVEAVHAEGMLHRDIKPDNILVTPEGRVVLIDFGSAREFAEGKTTSQTAMITPGYAPPEQYSERAKRGPFTDIYALGATLYFLLTGEKPIASTDRSFEELVPPHQLNPKVSSQVSSAVMLAMELKPDQRFQDVAEMKGAMTTLLSTHLKKASPTKKVPTTAPQTPKGPPPKSSSSTGVLVVIFSIFALLLLVGGTVTAVAVFNLLDEDATSDTAYADSIAAAATADSIAFAEALAAAADTLAAGNFNQGSPTWSCLDGTKTIDGSWANDGECDCDDCSDEYVFKCPEGKVINYSWIGDGDCDCNDCSDEEQGSDMVVCKGGEIIPRSYLNDGECDCNECDDES